MLMLAFKGKFLNHIINLYFWDLPSYLLISIQVRLFAWGYTSKGKIIKYMYLWKNFWTILKYLLNHLFQTTLVYFSFFCVKEVGHIAFWSTLRFCFFFAFYKGQIVTWKSLGI